MPWVFQVQRIENLSFQEFTVRLPGCLLNDIGKQGKVGITVSAAFAGVEGRRFVPDPSDQIIRRMGLLRLLKVIRLKDVSGQLSYRLFHERADGSGRRTAARYRNDRGTR